MYSERTVIFQEMIPVFFSWSLIVCGWSLVFFVLSCTKGVSITEKSLRLFYLVTVKLFFREITVSHAERIPPNKPVMLVCAPHANQFVDAMVLSTHLQQNPFFIGAASSFRKYKIVGLLMRWMHSIIPVERPQDRKQDIRGKGVIQGDTVKGFGTQFTTETTEGGSLLVGGMRYRIKHILDDCHMTVTITSPREEDETQHSLAFIPKTDYRMLFQTVWHVLSRNRWVAIFPEGGSHDRSNISSP